MGKTYKLARTVEEATVMLDFDRPLEGGDPRWQDFDEARGDQVTNRLKTVLSRKPPGDPSHIVFASHRGAGKTTEIKRLINDLRQRYFCVYFEANVEMDAFKIEREDLFLVMARVIEETLRKEGHTLPKELLQRITDWFSENVVSHALGKDYAASIEAGVEVKGQIPFFASLFSRMTALCKEESIHREEVKNILRKYPGTLLASVNQLLAAGREALKAEGKELMIVIDNLDRYEPSVIDDLLVKGGDQVRLLECSLILTPPIGLVLQPISTTLDTYFRCEQMPTIRLRRREDPYHEFTGHGRDLLLRALGKRIDLNVLIPDETTRNRLVFASGGSVRELLERTQEATLETAKAPITLDMVERVIKRRRQRLRDLVDANGWWETLIFIAKNKRLSEDPKGLQVIFHRLAFLYNGDGWYDIHPLLAELPEVQKALAP